MWPDDMPDPSDTRRWYQWFQQQDPSTQNQVVFNFGLSDANQPVMGSDVGGYQPEIGAQNYGMLDQLAPPPVINSKGVVQPQGTEQMQKETNLFQDRLSLGTDNMLAAIAGQFAPTAFTPTYEPQGNPVVQGGLRNLQSMSNTGGWEGFVAQQMLPKDYGGGGMSSSQAKAALMKVIMQPESDAVTPEAKQLRDELLSSLPLRYETTGGSTNPQDKPVNKDITTAQGIANTYDLGSIDQETRDWQKQLVSDPVASYTDPQTGLSYAGAKAKNTPTMDWFDKYGLPYANKRYDDPDQISQMQDAVAPWQYQGQQMDEDLARQDALAANQTARDNLANANSQYDVLMKAYNEVTKAGAPLDPNRPRTPEKRYDPANGMNGAVIVPDRSVNIPGPVLNGMGMRPGGLYSPPVNIDVVKQQIEDAKNNPPGPPPVRTGNSDKAKFMVDLDGSGNFIGLSADQQFPAAVTYNHESGGLKGGVFTDWTKPGTVLPGEDPTIHAARGMLPKAATGNRRVMQIADLKDYANRIKDAQRAAAATVPGIQAASNSSETSMQRQLARARMMGLASTGRTPLADTLAGRMMAARSAGIYG